MYIQLKYKKNSKTIIDKKINRKRFIKHGFLSSSDSKLQHVLSLLSLSRYNNVCHRYDYLNIDKNMIYRVRKEKGKIMLKSTLAIMLRSVPTCYSGAYVFNDANTW